MQIFLCLLIATYFTPYLPSASHLTK